MRFCPYCGAPVVPAAKFCVECGRQIDRSAAGGVKGLRLTAAFVGVFLAILIVGLIVVTLIVPRVSEVKLASPPQPPSPVQGQQSAQKLPPDHPKIELPAEARRFVDQVEKDARAKPHDIAAWNKFGEVTMRAAMLDPTYYAKAEEAYGHALKLDPDNPDALRGFGNLNYDHKNYDQATAAYEHYLKERPDDPEVRTDLGTMYLYTNNPDQAVVQYKRAIKEKPDFFEAYYNMGIAYGAQNDEADARKAFEKALTLAADDASRSKVQEMLSKLGGAGPQVASAPRSNPPAEQSPAPAPSRAAAPPAAAEREAAPAGGAAKAASDSFQGEIEQMVRGIPFAGPKVQSVKWPDKLKATVLMENFPMDQMPPFAKAKFLSDLKGGIKNAKTAHDIKDTVEVDIADGATGEVMESVSQ